MYLMDFFENVFCLEFSVLQSTARTMRFSLRSLEHHAGESLAFESLTEQMLSAWIRDSTKAPKTIKRERADVLTVWEAAADRGVCRHPIRKRVRKVKVPKPIPEGFTESELPKLIKASAGLPGCFPDGRPRATYFLALLHTGNDSGLRRDDLRRLSMRQIDQRGRGATIMRKTGRPHEFQLRPSTIALLRALGGNNPLRWPYCEKSYREWVGKIKKQAGVKIRGLCQPLRRTAASLVERDSPGSSQRFLGHQTPGLAQTYYHVPKLLRTKPPVMPPPIDGDAA